MCIVDRDTVAMVTFILCFYSSVLEIDSPYISYVKNKNEDATSDYDHTPSMLMTVDT